MRSVSRWTLLVLVILGSVSVGGYAVIRHSVQRQDQMVLDKDAGQIHLLQQTALQTLEPQLRGVALSPVNARNSPQVFADDAKPLLNSPAASVAVVDISGAQPRVILATGTDLRVDQPLPAQLGTAVMGAKVRLSSGLVHLGARTLLYFEAVPSAHPKYVGLQTSMVNLTRPTTKSSGPYSRVYLDVYEGPAARPGRLIGTTFGPGRLPGPVATATTRVGSVIWLDQISAKTSPSGAFTEVSPWIALAVGIVVTVALASLVETLSRRRKHAEDLAARVAEENKRLYTEQRTVADTLQSALLPEALPDLDGAEVAVRYLPSGEGTHVGGDWYDVIRTDATHVLVVVGDVSRRGVPGVETMARLRYATRAYAAQGDAPTVILEKLSNVLPTERTGLFATVLMIQADLGTGEISIVNAGHLPPLLQHGNDSKFIETDIGVPVGVSSTSASYTPTTVPISPGDSVLAFTDGLIERPGESLDAGLERLREVAALDGAPSLEGWLSDIVGSLTSEGVADETVLLGVRWQA